MLLTSSDTKRTLMHLFLFTNFAQRELASICMQSIHDRNKLSLHYTLALKAVLINAFFNETFLVKAKVRFESIFFLYDVIILNE